MIKIHGFNKLTLLDYPGRLACTIFLGNCNFRCPFCHNAGLVLNPNQKPVVLQTYKESGQVIRPVFSSYSREQLENFRQMLTEHIGQVEIRGV